MAKKPASGEQPKLDQTEHKKTVDRVKSNQVNSREGA